MTTSWVDAVATGPGSPAASSIRKIPSGSGAGSKRSVCSLGAPPRLRERRDLGAEDVEDADGDVRGVFSVYVIVVLSAIASPFGETVSGSAASPAIASEVSPPPIRPSAGVTSLRSGSRTSSSPEAAPSRPTVQSTLAPAP